MCSSRLKVLARASSNPTPDAPCRNFASDRHGPFPSWPVPCRCPGRSRTSPCPASQGADESRAAFDNAAEEKFRLTERADSENFAVHAIDELGNSDRKIGLQYCLGHGTPPFVVLHCQFWQKQKKSSRFFFGEKKVSPVFRDLPRRGKSCIFKAFEGQGDSLSPKFGG